MADKRLIVMAAGGSGGHIYPAVAVAKAWLGEYPSDEILFVGTKRGLESTVAPKENFEIRFISARGVFGKNIFSITRGLAATFIGFAESLMFFGKSRPSLIIGTGGYVSVPPMMAGWFFNVPLVAIEVNFTLGLANRVLLPFVDKIAVAFEDTLKQTGVKGELTGTPVRVFRKPAPRDAKESAENFKILVLGGSQGAEGLNNLIISCLPHLAHLKDKIRWTHIKGAKKGETLEDAYKKNGFRAEIYDYVHDMDEAYDGAKLVIARAGAITLAELALLEKPSVLIPFKYAGEHQRGNAELFRGAGAAEVFEPKENDDEGKSLADIISSLVQNPEKLSAMADCAKKLSAPDAAKKIVNLGKILTGAKANV